MFVQLEYELSFAAPFHFSTGIREGLIDRTVIRDAGDYLYVPASTFKGVLREQCEHLCHFYASDGLERQRVASPHNAYAALAEFGGAPSLISRTFGSPLSPCGLLFSDAKQPQDRRATYKTIQTSMLTQVRIDRLTQVAVDEALYTSQFGIPDLTFQGNIVGQLGSAAIPNLARPTPGVDDEVYTLTPTYALLLLLDGLLLVERMGGNKSTGKGPCRCVITSLALDRRSCPEEIWQDWLEHLDVLSDYHRVGKGAQP
jgi:CRISPR/Cas system CSM-associated protein Csm3 (group 7 of RAMP superfamily)